MLAEQIGKPRLGVAPLTALDLSVVDYVLAAGRAGYAEVGLRPARVSRSDPFFPLDVRSPEFSRLEEALATAGVRVLDLEVFAIGAGTGPEEWDPVLEVGARLGATYLNVVGDHPEAAAFDELVIRLSRDAAAVGIVPVLEPIAYRPFDSFEWALRLAERAGCKVELDLLHFLRTGASVELIASAPEAFPIVQLCDAPAELSSRSRRLQELSESEDPEAWQVVESRSLRLPVGDGDAPARQLLEMLPDDVHLSVEVPHVDLRDGRSAAEWMSWLADRTRQTMATWPG